MYESEQKIVMNKVKSLQELYNELVLEFHDYDFVCLQDIFVKGMPAFLFISSTGDTFDIGFFGFEKYPQVVRHECRL